MISHDSFFRGAHGKKICQDFAISGINHDNYDNATDFGIVADGCSSAPESEKGAVDIAEALAMYLLPGCNIEYSFMAAVGRADAMRTLRGKSKFSLYATLLCMAVDSDGNYRTAICGDGFQIFRRRGTTIYEIYQTEFSENTPPYPAYFLTEDMRNFESLCARNKNERIQTRYILDLTQDTMQTDEYVSPWKMDEAYPSVCHVMEKPIADYDLGLVLSDGLGSFKDKEDKPVPLEKMFRIFLNFKNLHGDFVQRRMNFSWSQIAELEWHNTDDFSIAGVSDV